MSFRDIHQVLEEWNQGSAYERMNEAERRRHEEMRRVVQAFVDQTIVSKKICSVCSVVYEPVVPGTLEVTNWDKHVMSPIPCPECAERFAERMREAVRQARKKQHQAVYDALLRNNNGT